MLKLKRAYEEPTQADGYRVLVDRLWPRGLKKEKAKLNLWMKDVAPSKELRRWYGHDTEKWEEFRMRYREELQGHEKSLRKIIDKAERGTVTLVFGAKDEDHNNAVVLKEYLQE